MKEQYSTQQLNQNLPKVLDTTWKVSLKSLHNKDFKGRTKILF